MTVAPAEGAAPRRLLLVAGSLALVVTALLMWVVLRLAQTRLALAETRAGCECCAESSL